MTSYRVTLTVEVRDPDAGYLQKTTRTIEPQGHDLPLIESKLAALAAELEGQQRLDLNDEGKA